MEASKGILPDGHSSTLGYLIWLSTGYTPGNSSPANILSCKSSKISRTVSSTYKAETLGMTEAIIKQTGKPFDLIKVEIICDTVESVYSTK